MEKVAYDSGVIKVIVRPLRDNSAEIDQTLPAWQRTHYLESYRAAQGIAAVRDAAADGVLQQSELNFWFGRVNSCMSYGIALGVFVGAKQPDGTYAFGAPVAAHLALPDNMDSSRALLQHTSIEAFGGPDAQKIALDWIREWAAKQGRKLYEKRVEIKWIEV